MDFPIVQFISPVPSPLPTEGSEPMPGGFAELIDALLDSLVGSDEALTGFDERAEVPEEPQTGDETARTAFPAVAAALAATPPVLPGESAPQPVAEPATGADSASDMVEAVADRIPQYAVPGGVPAPSAPAAPVPDDRDPPLTLDPEPVPGTGHDAGLDPVPAPAVGSEVGIPAAPPNPPVEAGEVEVPESTAVGEPSEPGPNDEIRPASRPVEHRAADTGDATPVASGPSAGSETGNAADVARADLESVIVGIEEWLERTGGAEPTTISVELPDPDGDLLVRVALRDGRLELDVVRPGGDPPTWLIDQLDEALARHGFEMADDRRRQPDTQQAPEHPPLRRPRIRTRRTEGLWI